MKNLIFVLFTVFSICAYGQQKNFKFSKNIGQIFDQNGRVNDDVCFLGIAQGLNIQIKKNGFSYDTYKENSESKISNTREINSLNSIDFDRVDFRFLNSLGSGNFIYENNNLNNFYQVGNNKIQLENTSVILQKNVYPNIDVEYLFEEGNFKYNLIVNKGASIKDISIKIGAKNKAYLKDQKINIDTKNGTITEAIPVSFYNNSQQKINVRYELNGDILSFKTDENLNGDAFTIDPIGALNRVWGTYYGGARHDEVYNSAIDEDGNIYVTGWTNSVTAIATAGAYHSTYDAGDNALSNSGTAFITKFAPSGAQVWGSYYGAIGAEVKSAFRDIAIKDGVIYVAGITEDGFTLVNPTQNNSYQGGVSTGDVILMSLDLNGTPIWSSYFGGSETDNLEALELDATGIYITGFTKSAGLGTPGVLQETITAAGNTDGYIAKLSFTGTTEWFTYLGGNNSDYPTGMLVKNNRLIVIGSTGSDDYPVTAGVFQNTKVGGFDLFATELSLTGAMVQSTYIGGNDNSFSMKEFDLLNGSVVFGIESTITTINTAGKHNPTPQTPTFRHTALVKLSPNFSALEGTYVGNTSPGLYSGKSYSVMVDSDKNIWITGNTLFTQGIATADAYSAQVPYNDFFCEDGYIVKYNEDLTQLLYGTYIGNGGTPPNGAGTYNGSERVKRMHEFNNTIIITGDISGTNTGGTNYGEGIIASMGAHDTNFEGSGGIAGKFEGFIMSFCPDDMNANLVSSQVFEACKGESIIVTPSENYTTTTWTGAENSSDFAPTFTSNGSYTLSTIDQYGCSSDTTFSLTFGGNEVEISVTTPSLGTVNTVNSEENSSIEIQIPSGFSAINWISNGGIACNDCEQTSYTATTADVIIVEAEDANGCSTSDTLIVSITEITPPTEPETPTINELDTLTLTIPQGFSPNADGINDVFVIEGIYILDVEVKVWNRWGSIVFEADKYQNNWNGTCKSKDCLGNGAVPEGTYFYSITKGEKNYQGYITIKK